MAKSAKVDPKLKKAIDDLLKEVTLDKMENGKPKYSLTDVVKVIDRKLKLAAIESNYTDTGYGSGFKSDHEEEE